ncbi:hypothetical protein J6590_068803 [Homalodisca vitripennis]|nr:hypothetical protein J6590_068803 [Homalodisca vitripennis]
MTAERLWSGAGAKADAMSFKVASLVYRTNCKKLDSLLDNINWKVQDMTVSNYKRKGKVNHVNVRVKWFRPVPVLISEGMAKATDLIIQLRNDAGRSKDNPFLFANGLKQHYFSGDAMREAAYACGYRKPESLKERYLRKHMVTVIRALNLTENDLRVASGFWGHTGKHTLNIIDYQVMLFISEIVPGVYGP